MWRRALTLSLVLLFTLALTAQAAPMRAPGLDKSLSFSGTTATCKATVYGDHGTDTVSLTVKLWQGTTCLETWSASGTGYAKVNKTATVTRGKTYKMTVDFTVNGVAEPQLSITKTCP